MFTLPLIAGLVLALGIAAFAVGFARRRSARAPEHWPRTSAYVRHARVVEHVDGAGGRPARWYEPELTYEYRVGNRTYVSHHLADRAPPMSRAVAEALVLKFAPECVAELRYDPDDPERVVLALEPHGAGIAAEALGSLLMLTGLIGLILYAAAVLR